MNDTHLKSLSDFVRQTIHDKKLSYRKVAEKSRGLITYSAVSNIINGYVKEPEMNTLKGLAAGLDVPEEVIFALARGTSPNDVKIADERFNRLATVYAKMPVEEKDKVELILKFLEGHIFEWESRQPTSKMPAKAEYVKHGGKSFPVLVENSETEE